MSGLSATSDVIPRRSRRINAEFEEHAAAGGGPVRQTRSGGTYSASSEADDGSPDGSSYDGDSPLSAKQHQ